MQTAEEGIASTRNPKKQGANRSVPFPPRAAPTVQERTALAFCVWLFGVLVPQSTSGIFLLFSSLLSLARTRAEHGRDWFTLGVALHERLV